MSKTDDMTRPLSVELEPYEIRALANAAEILEAWLLAITDTATLPTEHDVHPLVSAGLKLETALVIGQEAR